MAVRLTARGFWVRYADGRTRRFSWAWLVPFLLLPALFVWALAFQSQPVVRYYVRRAIGQPSYWRGAWRMFVHVNRVSLENLLWSTPEPLTSELPTLHLYVGNNTVDDMMKAKAFGDPALDHAVGGDKPYFPGVLVDETGAHRETQICLRGANVWHHRPEKPSLRLRLRQEDELDRRFVELSRPEDPLALKNWLPDQLGRRLGLMSDLGDHVRLYLNNKCLGVYLRTARPEEPLALLNGRMPGTFFKGDLLDEATRGEGLWASRAPWSLDGESEEPFNLALFDRFLAASSGPPGLASVQALEEVLDEEVYARWAALSIATCSVHTDEFHNHTYFVASNQGQVEVVPWDLNGFGVHVPPTVPPDLELHPPMRMISRDPRWVHRRNEVLWQLLEGDCRPDRLGAEVDAALARLRPDLRADENLSSFEWTNVGLLEVPWSVRCLDEKAAELKEFIASRHGFLRAYLLDARVSVAPDGAGSLVTVWGAAAVRVTRDDGQPVQADTWAGAPGLLYPGLSEATADFTEFTWEKGAKYPYASPAPLVYHLDAPPARLRFTHALAGTPVTPVAPPAASAPARSVHPSAFPAPVEAPLVLGPGEVQLTEDLCPAPGQGLVIRPGTRLLLAPRVGIYVRGQVLAEGTAEAPIEVLPLGSEPWGAFGVLGAGAETSRFRHVRVSGGSVGERFAKWKGMFDLYGAPNHDVGQTLLADCAFGENFIGDDAVNLAEIDARVERCTFADARSDGLDLDRCRALVLDSRFQRSGNDGLDNMTCQVDVRRCTFTGCGDKAISMGEATRITVQGCLIEDCVRGIELKDASRGLVVDSTFRGCGLAVNAYQKKPHYGQGGTGALVRCRLEGSRKADVSLKRRCRLVLVETPVSTRDARPEQVEVAPSLRVEEWGPLLEQAGRPVPPVE